MKHILEFKLPKFLNFKGPDLSEEEKEKAKNLAKIGGGMLLGGTVIYLLGYNRGLKKATSGRNGIYIIKQ